MTLDQGSSHDPPRLADVAKRAGVSTGTVSHALRGDRRIRSATREKVLRAADELGYTLDVHASALGSRRGARNVPRELIPIGLVYNSPPTHHAEKLYQQIQSRAQQMGYETHAIVLPQNQPAPKIFSEWWHRGLEGLILCQVRSRPDLHDVDWSRFSLVTVGREPETLPVRRVRPNNFTSAKRLWDICWDRGYRRIGAAPLSHNPRLLDDEARLGGLLAAEASHLSSSERIPPFIGNMRDETGFREWIRLWEPDCVIGFATNNRWWLRDLGLRTAFAACMLPEHALSPVAGMVENNSAMLMGALDLLDQEIRHRRRGIPETANETVVESRFREGKTLPPAGAPVQYED